MPKNWIIRETFNAFNDGDTAIASDNMTMVGDLKVSAKYDETRKVVVNPPGPKRCMAFALQELASPARLEAHGNFTLGGDQVALSYGALEFSFDMLLETPIIGGELVLRIAPQFDQYDFYDLQDVCEINIGKVNIQIANYPGANGVGGNELVLDGYTLVSVKVGDSAAVVKNIGRVTDKWLAISGSYDSANGTATVDLRIEKNLRHTWSFANLTNLVVSSRSPSEFAFSLIKTATGGYTQQGGSFDGLAKAPGNVFIDNLFINVP